MYERPFVCVRAISQRIELAFIQSFQSRCKYQSKAASEAIK
ncbi:hypothetical protein BSU04_09130 [Caballeronia sordidicola]|uniref:Uncharacterized protein n=1 Tax=Caballeronia sordidicola TaxID=196367 RepID=A0A226X756_CABSO|nr:hypothetical protein BSU04_09130 [Caballeronia sordidicola]